jgi:hypothetical protein
VAEDGAAEDPKCLARFCYVERYYSKSHMRFAAFMPPPDLRLSMFVVDGMNDAEIHAHGVTWATQPGPPPLPPKAFGKIGVEAILKQKLSVHRDNDPPRHAVVVGWPTEKSEWKLIAQELAAAASAPFFPIAPVTTDPSN